MKKPIDMKIKIDYKRFFISAAVILVFLIFVIALFKSLNHKTTSYQEDNIQFIKKTLGLKNSNITESDIMLQRLPDDTFIYKYQFEDQKNKYSVYMKENKAIVYYKKYNPSDVVNSFSLKDLKSTAFKTLYRLAPYTKGNVEIIIEQDKGSYICNFYRVEGDKKVFDNWGRLVFNKDNGELLEYDINWFSDISFKRGNIKGNEKDKIISQIKVVPVIDKDSFLKYTTLNNVFGLKNMYYDYVESAIFPKIATNPSSFDQSVYNSYVESVLKKASLDYVKLKIGKILNLISSTKRHIPFSSDHFKFLSSGYSYSIDTQYGKIRISIDRLGNILKANINLTSTSLKEKVDQKVLNDRAEQIMRTLLNKYVTAKMYSFDDDKRHSLSYKLYIGNSYILNGILNISFDRSSGEVLEINFDLGFKPEFMQKVKSLKDAQEYLKLLTLSGFEEVFVLTKDYGKVYLYENNVEAHLALKPKFDLSYLMNAIK